MILHYRILCLVRNTFLVTIYCSGTSYTAGQISFVIFTPILTTFDITLIFRMILLQIMKNTYIGVGSC